MIRRGRSFIFFLPPDLRAAEAIIFSRILVVAALSGAAQLHSLPSPSRAHESRDSVEVTMVAEPARLSLLPGKTTDVYAYNGTVPGPTLEFREGDRVVIHFRNKLPVPTTVHWHGLHIPADMDGSPFHPIAPGETHDYTFTLPAGSAGTYWYHPHPHHDTGNQIARGLFGAIVVRAADDPLPSLREQLLILSDNRFGEDGTIALADPNSLQGRIDFENGREGDVLFVNGRIMPTVSIRSGEIQRWRIVNASAARIYRFAIPGHHFLHVGTDGGLFEHPVEREEILLAVGERAEILVRGSAAPGTRVVVQTLPYDRYIPQTRPKDWDRPRDLFTLAYAAEAPLTPITLPSTLRKVPPLDTMAVDARRFITLSQGMINGQLMDLARVDIQSLLGRTEIWVIENIVGMDHPFHLHGFQFQVLDRDGVPEPQLQWKDVVNVPKHQTARFIVRFDDFPGKWMYHCHILTHEDHGMMGVLQLK